MIKENRVTQVLSQTKDFRIIEAAGFGGALTEVMECIPKIMIIILDESDATKPHNVVLLQEKQNDDGKFIYRLCGGRAFSSIHDYMEAKKEKEKMEDVFRPIALEMVKNQVGVDSYDDLLEFIGVTSCSPTIDADIYIFVLTLKIDQIKDLKPSNKITPIIREPSEVMDKIYPDVLACPMHTHVFIRFFRNRFNMVLKPESSSLY